MHWTVHPQGLGRHAVELATPRLPIRLEVYDGGGYAPSHGVWRIAGRAAVVVEAASC